LYQSHLPFLIACMEISGTWLLPLGPNLVARFFQGVKDDFRRIELSVACNSYILIYRTNDTYQDDDVNAPNDQPQASGACG
jgi:hypothetical protein